MQAGSGLGASAFAGDWGATQPKPAGDMWASSVFQHLVSLEPAARQCTSHRGQRIEKHTSVLQELLLQLQFCSIEDRPTLAYSLRHQFMATFNALCAAEAPEPVRDPTFLSEPTHFSDLADRSTLTSLGESLPMEAAVQGDCSGMGPADPTFDHCLRPDTEFPTDASYINSKVKHLFFELEGGAKTKVIEFMEESDTFLPPVVRFKGIDTVASINRLAAFTGVRFFRSCAIQCLAVTRDGTTCHSTPSTVRSVDIDPFGPESISLLIQIIEGHAPKRITLQQAFDIFAVFEYCLADCLFEMLPEYLEPMLERLNAHEIVLLLAYVLRSCPEADADEDTDAADSTNATPPQPALSPRASGGVPTTPTAVPAAAAPAAAAAARKPGEPATAATTPRGYASDAGACAPGLPPLFARMLELASTNASMRRRDRSADDMVALAAHAFQSFAFLGPHHCSHILQMASLPLLPGWLRAGSLAACCHCAPAAAPADPPSPSSGPSSPDAPRPPAPTVAAVTAAATHVLHAWGPDHAGALQHFLATAAAAAATAAAVQLWTAVLWHFAAEGRALRYARITHTLSPILPPAPPHEPCSTVSLPLAHPRRSLLLSKMPVARCTKIKWSTSGPSGFSLAVQNTPEDRLAEAAGAPPIGAFIRNEGSASQSLRFALGIIPEPSHAGGAGGAAVAASRVVSTVAHVQRSFSDSGSLRAAVDALQACQLPVFAKAKFAAFPPAKALGFKSFAGDPVLMDAWTRCAPAAALGRWVGLPVYVFLCFEHDAEQAAKPADAAGAAAAAD